MPQASLLHSTSVVPYTAIRADQAVRKLNAVCVEILFPMCPFWSERKPIHLYLLLAYVHVLWMRSRLTVSASH